VWSSIFGDQLLVQPMTSEAMKQPPFDASVLSELACPACFGDLLQEPARLACAVCGRRYPIVDGIPVLIVERAEAGNVAK
jgi:uncharacterized protein